MTGLFPRSIRWRWTGKLLLAPLACSIKTGDVADNGKRGNSTTEGGANQHAKGTSSDIT
jgi:hypothetical protein